MIHDSKTVKDSNEEPSWLNSSDISISNQKTNSSVIYSLTSHDESKSPVSHDLPTALHPSWMDEKPVTMEKSPSIPKSTRSSMGDHIAVEIRPVKDDLYNCCGIKLDPVLISFQIFHLAAGLTSLASISANFYVFCSISVEDNDFREVILRIYAILFAFVIILIETDWDMFTKYFLILQSWFLRGLWYGFVGLITVRGKSPIGAAENVIGFTLMSFGIAYSIMSIMRIQQLKLRRHQYTWAHPDAGYRRIS